MTNEQAIARLEKIRLDIDHLISEIKENDSCAVQQKIAESEETKKANELFDELWKLYPRKAGKSAISLAAKKRLLKVGREPMILAVSAYAATTKGKDEKYILMGSTFFNTRYQDYLGVKPQQKAPIVYKDGVARLEW